VSDTNIADHDFQGCLPISTILRIENVNHRVARYSQNQHEYLLLDVYRESLDKKAAKSKMRKTDKQGQASQAGSVSKKPKVDHPTSEIPHDEDYRRQHIEVSTQAMDHTITAPTLPVIPKTTTFLAAVPIQVTSIIPSKPLSEFKDIKELLTVLGLEEYEHNFAKEEITPYDIPLLKEEDLSALVDNKLGPLRLLQRIAKTGEVPLSQTNETLDEFTKQLNMEKYAKVLKEHVVKVNCLPYLRPGDLDQYLPMGPRTRLIQSFKQK